MLESCPPGQNGWGTYNSLFYGDGGFVTHGGQFSADSYSEAHIKADTMARSLGWTEFEIVLIDLGEGHEDSN